MVGGLFGEVLGPLVGGLIKKKIHHGRGIGDTLRGVSRRGEEALRGYAKRGVQKIQGSAMRDASGRTFLQGEFKLWVIPPWM